MNPVIANDHRFHGKDHAEVQKIFGDQLKGFINNQKFSTATWTDTTRMCANFWKLLKLDMTEENQLTRLFWTFPLPGPPANAVLKSLQKVFNAHGNDQTKYQGIIDKLRSKYDERNGVTGSERKFLSSVDVDKLFIPPNDLVAMADKAIKTIEFLQKMDKEFDAFDFQVPHFDIPDLDVLDPVAIPGEPSQEQVDEEMTDAGDERAPDGEDNEEQQGLFVG